LLVGVNDSEGELVGVDDGEIVGIDDTEGFLDGI